MLMQGIEMQSFCFCGKAAGSACGRCRTEYCSRECQLRDWPAHKSRCQHLCDGAAAANRAIAAIFGNIAGVALSEACDVEIKINESLGEFEKCNIHCAYIKSTARAREDKLSIRLSFDDFSTTVVKNIDSLDKYKKKNNPKIKTVLFTH